MKQILIGALAALLSIATFGATLAPIQLLSSAGSTSGQVITSTGASTPPAWASVTYGILPTMAANTMLGNSSGSTAPPAAVTMPSCSASGNSLQWGSGTGFTCATGYALATSPLSQFAATTSAQLAGVLSDETGTGVAVFGTTPTITTRNIVGVTSGSAAAAGSVGETLSATGTAVSLTSGVPINCTSKALSAGDYDVWGSAIISNAASTIFQNAQIGVNTVSATQPASPNYSFLTGLTYSANATYSNVAPQQPVSLFASGTAFLVITASFTTSTATATCTIWARRRR